MMTVNASDDILKGYDEEQVRLMAEMCIEVDENDNAIGAISKKDGMWLSSLAIDGLPISAQSELPMVEKAAQRLDCRENLCCSSSLPALGWRAPG